MLRNILSDYFVLMFRCCHIENLLLFERSVSGLFFFVLYRWFIGRLHKFYQNTDIQEMKEIGIFSDNDLQNKAKNGIFQYPEQYREIQNTLLQLLINE